MLTKLSSFFIALVSVIDLLEFGKCGWIEHPDLRTGFVNLYNPVPNKFYSAIDTPVSFLIGFSNSISAARSAGVSIIGFNTLITNDFSVNTTI